mmetsp:Transcript_26194/g.83725  ORF Transcript_26194/g.83725 Transcript_26194/m.83725 type:complete len:466 (+) Transcript_26194:406-1803(+)
MRKLQKHAQDDVHRHQHAESYECHQKRVYDVPAREGVALKSVEKRLVGHEGAALQVAHARLAPYRDGPTTGEDRGLAAALNGFLSRKPDVHCERSQPHSDEEPDSVLALQCPGYRAKEAPQHHVRHHGGAPQLLKHPLHLVDPCEHQPTHPGLVALHCLGEGEHHHLPPPQGLEGSALHPPPEDGGFAGVGAHLRHDLGEGGALALHGEVGVGAGHDALCLAQRRQRAAAPRAPPHVLLIILLLGVAVAVGVRIHRFMDNPIIPFLLQHGQHQQGTPEARCQCIVPVHRNHQLLGLASEYSIRIEQLRVRGRICPLDFFGRTREQSPRDVVVGGPRAVEILHQHHRPQAAARVPSEGRVAVLVDHHGEDVDQVTEREVARGDCTRGEGLGPKLLLFEHFVRLHQAVDRHERLHESSAKHAVHGGVPVLGAEFPNDGLGVLGLLLLLLNVVRHPHPQSLPKLLLLV